MSSNPPTVTLLLTLTLLFLPNHISSHCFTFEVPTDQCPLGYRWSISFWLGETRNKNHLLPSTELSLIASDYAKTTQPPNDTQMNRNFKKPYYPLEIEITWPEVITASTINITKSQITQLFTQKLNQFDASIWHSLDYFSIGFGCYLTTTRAEIPNTSGALLRLTALIAVPKKDPRKALASYPGDTIEFEIPTIACPLDYYSIMSVYIYKFQAKLMKGSGSSTDLDDLAASYAQQLQRTNGGQRLERFHQMATMDTEIRWPEVLTLPTIKISKLKIFKLFNETIPKANMNPPIVWYGFGCQLTTYPEKSETILRLTMLVQDQAPPPSPIKPSTKAPTTQQLPLFTCPIPSPCPPPSPKVCPICPTCPTPRPVICPTTPPPVTCPTLAPVTCPKPPPASCPTPAPVTCPICPSSSTPFTSTRSYNAGRYTVPS